MSASETPGGSEREPIVSRRTRKSSGPGVWREAQRALANRAEQDCGERGEGAGSALNAGVALFGEARLQISVSGPQGSTPDAHQDRAGWVSSAAACREDRAFRAQADSVRSIKARRGSAPQWLY